MEWDTLEHSYTEKTNDWYASVIIIAGAGIALGFLLGNFLIVTLIFIGTIAFILMAAKRPEEVHVQILRKGIRVGDTLYPYRTLDGFAIIDYTPQHRLLLESSRIFIPIISIHIPDDIDIDDLHEEVSQYLPEKDLHESLPQLLMERIGF